MNKLIKKIIKCVSGDYIIVSDEPYLNDQSYTIVNTNDVTRIFIVEKLICNGSYDDTIRIKHKLFKDGFRNVIACTRFDDVKHGDSRIYPIDKIKMDRLTEGRPGNIFECDSNNVTHKVEEYIIKLT